MKQQIIELGKKLNLDLVVKFIREDLDIMGYEIYHKNNFVYYDRYFTGKTNNGLTYPSDKEECFNRIKEYLSNYKTNEL